MAATGLTEIALKELKLSTQQNQQTEGIVHEPSDFMRTVKTEDTFLPSQDWPTDVCAEETCRKTVNSWQIRDAKSLLGRGPPKPSALQQQSYGQVLEVTKLAEFVVARDDGELSCGSLWWSGKTWLGSS